MSIADAALIAEAIRGAYHGFSRNGKAPSKSRKGTTNRNRARLPLGIHHKEIIRDTAYAGLVRDQLFNDLLLIDQGYKDDQRTGRTIKARMFVFEGIVSQTSSSIAPGVLVKFDLILDRQPDGETATSEEIWEVLSPNTSAISLPNLHGKPRFQFLSSRTYDVNVYNASRSVTMRVPLNFTTTFGETTAGVTADKDILTNALIFSIRCIDANGGLTADVSLYGTTRVLFAD